jgi:hypothetical protein
MAGWDQRISASLLKLKIPEAQSGAQLIFSGVHRNEGAVLAQLSAA